LDIPILIEKSDFRRSTVFKVKATVVAFLGNQEIYPCHMGHEVGDEVIFDGESYHGRLCPDVWPLIAPKVSALHQAGPRYVEWGGYYPFWYCPPSFKDLSLKKYDGLGFRNNLTTIVPPEHDMANLVPSQAFRWPPHDQRDILMGASVICPDSRTSMVVELTAFDLGDKGFDVPFFRRQMTILNKLHTKGPVPVDKLIATFSQKQIEDIYPPLSPMLVRILVEELALMGYVETANGQINLTDKGLMKQTDFINSLSAEEKEALQITR
jgi:uncharacterized repeat protein (TIGR04076 family)